MSIELSLHLQHRVAWILGPEPLADNGLLASWAHPERSGYAYPEATAFAVRVLADLSRRTGDESFRERARTFAGALVRSMDPSGGFGRGEWLYTFDTAVCAAALADVGLDDEARLARAFVEGGLAERLALRPRNDARPEEIAARWSTRFGPHLIKSAASLPGDADRQRATALAREWTETHAAEGRFHTSAQQGSVYVHAHCYALEGLWALEGPSPILLEGVRWLGEQQQADGSLPRWWHCAEGVSGRAGDATAQAVRLWALVDRERYAERIAVGLGFLATLQAPTGGIRYSGDHAESNAWTTLFAIQAELIASHGAAPDCIA